MPSSPNPSRIAAWCSSCTNSPRDARRAADSALGSEDQPEDKAEQRQDEDQDDPEDLRSGRSTALDRLHDRPDVGNQQQEAEEAANFDSHAPSLSRWIRGSSRFIARQ